MAWDYNYRIDGQALDDYAIKVWIPNEQQPNQRVRSVLMPSEHGERYVARAFYDPYVHDFRTLLRYTDSAGAVTHPNGEAGHVFENRTAISGLLVSRGATPAELQRNDPDKGEVRQLVVCRRGSTPSNPRHSIRWPLRTIDPFWASAGALNSEPDPVLNDITTAGDAPVNESLVITFTGGNTPRLTNTTNGDWVEINDATMANPVVVTIGKPTRSVIQNSNNVIGKLARNRPWWMELEPGLNEFTLSGGGSVQVQWRDKWL